MQTSPCIFIKAKLKKNISKNNKKRRKFSKQINKSFSFNHSCSSECMEIPILLKYFDTKKSLSSMCMITFYGKIGSYQCLISVGICRVMKQGHKIVCYRNDNS